MGLDTFIKEKRERWDKERPTFEDFMDPEEAVIKREELEARKAKMQPQTREAIAGEYAVIEGVYDGYWLSGNPDMKSQIDDEAFVAPTSEYDDIENHTDLVVAIGKEKEWMFLGIDVTTSRIDSQINDKLNQTVGPLKKFQMPTVDYALLKDREEIPQGKIELPRVVVGLDKEAVEPLAMEFLTNKEKIGEHPVQLEIIQEIIDQLTVAIEIVVNKTLQRDASKIHHHEFKSPEQALQFVNGEIMREKITKLHSRAMQIIDAHSQVLEYMLEVQKEKSSLGEIPPERARESQIFRMLAPLKTAELLEKAA